MEKMGGTAAAAAGKEESRKSHLVQSLKVAVRSLLTCCSKEEFEKAFSSFSKAEQDTLHRLFIQIITSLHKMIEDEFESLCLETQVGSTLDMVDQLMEEQSLDPLFSEKTNLMDVANDVEMAKKHEIQFLMSMLEKAEVRNRLIRARVEQLKIGGEVHISSTVNAAEKLKREIFKYGTCGDGL